VASFLLGLLVSYAGDFGAAPPAQVIVKERRPEVIEDEERRPRVGIDININKQRDRNHVDVDIHARP